MHKNEDPIIRRRELLGWPRVGLAKDICLGGGNDFQARDLGTTVSAVPFSTGRVITLAVASRCLQSLRLSKQSCTFLGTG